MKQSLIPMLEHKAYELRRLSIMMTTRAGSGHPTSALSAADIVSVLFFGIMQYDPRNFSNPDNDRFILSKGHASPVLYAAWEQAGVLTEADLEGYRSFNSVLEGHPTLRFSHAEAATGSLGMGLSIGAGYALAGIMDKRAFTTYVLMGDSELSEGSIWEAAQIAAYYKLTRLVAIVDCNKLGQSTAPMAAQEGDEAERYAQMFAAFGWQTHVVNGHDVQALYDVFQKIRDAQKPVAIFAKTIKGYGVKSVEGRENFHGKPFSPQEYDSVIAQLKERFPKAAASKPEPWQPMIPAMSSTVREKKSQSIAPCTYAKGTQIATRKAYGDALVAVGAALESVVSLDAEVKNSTYAELFEAAFPDRFIQCFIAEQNMVSMAVGLQRRGKIPFVSTFGAFLTRAHDQLRMAAVGTSPLRVVGSHAGVSIGQDGPSQMALEDIGMMCSLPGSIVLYPSDAVSTHALTIAMANYNAGISYLRTTRMATPVLYDSSESFVIGGCKVIRKSSQDRACIVAAGVTLFEALAVYELLKKDNIMVSIIDLYSIKPFDRATVCATVKASGGILITAEDHYLEGGLGQTVASELCNEGFTIKICAVTKLPRSGKPNELLAYEGIDAASLVTVVRALVQRA